MPSPALSIESLCAGLDLPEWVADFRHAAGGQVLFGRSIRMALGEEAKKLGGSRALIVTDQGLSQTPFVQEAVRSLAQAGVPSIVFDQVRENPTTEDVDRCVAVAAEEGVDLLIGLGGGSSLDTAK